MASTSDSALLDSGHFVYTIHSVIPLDSRQSFEDFQSEMNEVALRFDGYRGQSISFQEKDDGRHLLATTRIVFEALDQCLHWLDSPERRRLLHRAETLMHYRYQGTLEADSFDQWIQMMQPEKVPIWKVNLLVWLALLDGLQHLRPDRQLRGKRQTIVSATRHLPSQHLPTTFRAVPAEQRSIQRSRLYPLELTGGWITRLYSEYLTGTTTILEAGHEAMRPELNQWVEPKQPRSHPSTSCR